MKNPKTVVEMFVAEAKALSEQAGEAPIVVGVSGGADSVALGYLLHKYAPSLSVHWVHVDHQLRGGESDEDAAFVEKLARSWDIPIQIHSVETRQRMEKTGCSLEMAARELRYERFGQGAQALGARVVLTAHTRNDQLETVLMKWARGAAPGALGGIRPIDERESYTLMRPLLGHGRDDLRAWLTEEGVGWREDSSNTDERMLRNRVRKQLLPVMKEVFGEPWEDQLLRQSTIQREEDDWYKAVVLQWLNVHAKQGAISIKALQNEPAAFQRRILHHWMIASSGCPLQQSRWEQVQALAQSDEGSQGVDLERGWRLERVYDELTLLPLCPEVYAEQALSIPGEVRWAGDGILSAAPDSGYMPHDQGVPGQDSVGYVNAELTTSALTVRPWKPGDKIRIPGMTGRKKLQDIFTDCRVPQHQRNKIPLVCAGNKVIWIPGFSVHSDWLVPSADAPSIRLEWRRLHELDVRSTTTSKDGRRGDGS